MRSALFSPGALVLDGRFRVLRMLGAGGMGQVYLAEQVSLGRKVALKVLRQEMMLVPGMAERFHREARILSSVDHPSVVRVIDFGESNGAPCLVMELVEGQTLEAILRQGKMEPARAVRLLQQLAEGLAAIHERGVIHRDLKPENVLVTATPLGEQARLLDFGIARLSEQTAGPSATQAGLVLGTPEYVSPEQATASPLDARSDLYALGVLAFRVLSGKLPFPGPTPREYLLQHLSVRPPALETVAPHLSAFPELCRLVAACLEKDPERRPQSAAELAKRLAALPTGGTARHLAPPSAELARADATPSSSRPAHLSGPMPSHVRPKNLAVMLTDLKGFTERTSHQTREENARMLEEHDRLLVPLVRHFGGKLVQKRGDALLVTFQSPTECVRCGMAIQDRLWRHNAATPPERQLHVRVAIHVGDVLVKSDGLVGEPVQLVSAVEGVADAGEVVFTEAVHLAMARAEVAAEPCGDIEMPGRAERLKLYRCAKRAEGPPFGGMDLKVHSRVAEVLARVGGSVAALPRKAIVGAVAALAVLAVGGSLTSRWLDSPGRAAKRAWSEGDYAAVVATVEASRSKKEATAAMLLLEAQALHRLDRHSEEWSVLGGLAAPELEDAPDEVLDALLADFGRNERERALREQLDRLAKARARQIRSKLEDAWSPEQWGAVRYADLARLPDADLVDGYVSVLEGSDCRHRAIAATRLGELGDEDALEPLEKLRATPKKMGFLFAENCGQDEAGWAIRRITRKK